MLWLVLYILLQISLLPPNMYFFSSASLIAMLSLGSSVLARTVLSSPPSPETLLASHRNASAVDALHSLQAAASRSFYRQLKASHESGCTPENVQKRRDW